MLNTDNHNDLYSSKWINLAEERLGTKVNFATDDFFAEKENLIKPGRGIFIADKYTDRGKWMDGWESRRKRVAGHDWCEIKLGATGVIKALDIDTNHFLGNHPPFASVDACQVEGQPDESTEWVKILTKSSLEPGSQNFFEISDDRVWTHLRLNIYPDGGVARFRVYGEVKANWSNYKEQDLIDLTSVYHEGKVLHCNDMFFSSKDNLIAPGRGVNMGDGWETKRRRSPGHDWVILSLGRRGKVEEVEVDTAHFKGNFPESFSLDVLNLDDVGHVPLEDFEQKNWIPFIGKTKLKSDHQLFMKGEDIKDIGPITHVRMNIYPDGGISRLRLWGKIAE